MINEKFVSKGAASFTLNDDREKQVFYFLLLPKLTMLAFSSALEPLRIVNQLTQKEIYYSLRLERAHALLNETNMPITEIAAAIGFKSASHLSRQFKAKYNISPTSFRKGWRLN